MSINAQYPHLKQNENGWYYYFERASYPGRIFLINSPAYYTGTRHEVPARRFAVVVIPPEDPKAPPIVPKGDGFRDNWNGWYPQCKPGLESPWDGVTWGQPRLGVTDINPENFTSRAPIKFGDHWPLTKNVLFPIIKKARTLFGRDFYGFYLLCGTLYETIPGEIGFTALEPYRLIGDFAEGYENKPVVNL
jgi:hypothetical protein